MKKDIVAMLLAGGVGSRLSILARHRAKPAIPFGAIYRIIDFTLSNIAHSHIDVVGVLTQYKPLSLMTHIDNGRPWDLFGRTRMVEILPPKTGEEISDWYKGTSDAVYQNLQFLDDFSPELVLIVSGDHIYHMNYNELITYHRQKKADATVGLIEVPLHDAHHFGIAQVNREGRIIAWAEKPSAPVSNLASMGIYVFNTATLTQTVHRVAAMGGVDFAKDVIPVLLRKRVFGFRFKGYWRDVGTIDAYWNANMDMLKKESGLDIRAWHLNTNLSLKGEIGDRPSAYFSKHSHVEHSFIADGCVIEGRVQRSIVSPGVRVGKQAIVKDSILFHDAVIGPRAVVEKSVIDKEVLMGAGALLGHGTSIANKKVKGYLTTGITVVGKKAHIEARVSIGKNCIINPEITVRNDVPSGTTV